MGKGPGKSQRCWDVRGRIVKNETNLCIKEKKQTNPRSLNTLGGGPKTAKPLPRLAISWWMCGSRSRWKANGSCEHNWRKLLGYMLNLRIVTRDKGQQSHQGQPYYFAVPTPRPERTGKSAGVRTQRGDLLGRNSVQELSLDRECTPVPPPCLLPFLLLAWCLSLTNPTHAGGPGACGCSPCRQFPGPHMWKREGLGADRRYGAGNLLEPTPEFIRGYQKLACVANEEQ